VRDLARGIARLGDREYGLRHLQDAFSLHLRVAREIHSTAHAVLLYELAETMIELAGIEATAPALIEHFHAFRRHTEPRHQGTEQLAADHLALTIAGAQPLSPASVELVKYLMSPIKGKFHATLVRQTSPVNEELRWVVDAAMHGRFNPEAAEYEIP